MVTFIKLLVSSLLGKKRSFFLSFVLIAILSTLSNLPIYVCHIMPDRYLPLAMTGYFIMLNRKEIYWVWMIQPGIFSNYVSERCESNTSLFMCKDKNTMPAHDRYHYFLWHDTSFLFKNCDTGQCKT